MYQVLYRKYRPRVFSDVVGQPQVTVTLKNELKLGRIHHAYLFTGSRGTGKTSCAKIFAKAVNCLNPQDFDPCGECEICRGIDAGEIFDVVEMDAASNRGIDDIKQIVDEVNFRPAKAKYRVYIIDEVHMLTREAWNALLKTLEEPPAHVIFILATTEVHKIPETILSRCQRFDFFRISPADIAARLKYICEKEQVKITDEAAMLIAVIADGALRDANSLLDRCIGICDDISVDIVRAAAGLTSKGHLFELCNCIINKNPQRALETLDTLYRESKDMARLCDELGAHMRSLMMIKTVKNPREMLAMSDGEFDAAQSQADYLTLADIVYYMDVLARAGERMKAALSPRTELEMALVKLTAPELDATDEALTARVAALEKTVRLLSSGTPAPKPLIALAPAERPAPAEPVSAPAEEPAAAPEPPAETVLEAVEAEPMPDKESDPAAEAAPAESMPVEKSAPDLSLPDPPAEEPVVDQPAPDPAPAKPKAEVDMKSLYENAVPYPQWRDVVDSLKQYSRTIASALQKTNAYISGDYILIETDHDIAFQLLKQSSQRAQIRSAITQIAGRPYKLGPYKKPEEEKKDDVLDNFIETLRQKGVNVSEE